MLDKKAILDKVLTREMLDGWHDLQDLLMQHAKGEGSERGVFLLRDALNNKMLTIRYAQDEAKRGELSDTPEELSKLFTEVADHIRGPIQTVQEQLGDWIADRQIVEAAKKHMEKLAPFQKSLRDAVREISKSKQMMKQ